MLAKRARVLPGRLIAEYNPGTPHLISQGAGLFFLLSPLQGVLLSGIKSEPTGPAGSYSWWGSLIHNKRDLTGQLYMRNRYYDPQAGRFTQEDPIGLAGGINLYGFADADPVSYADPYGLSAEECCRFGFEGDPRTVEREVEYAQSASRSERIVAGGLLAGAVVATFPQLVPAIGAGARRLWRSVRGVADDVSGQFGAKTDAREFVAQLSLPDPQAAAVNRAIARATSTSTITIARGRGGNMIVNITRPGRDGFQAVESTIARDGTKSVVQRAYNAAGRLVHNDPKTP